MIRSLRIAIEEERRPRFFSGRFGVMDVIRAHESERIEPCDQRRVVDVTDDRGSARGDMPFTTIDRVVEPAHVAVRAPRTWTGTT
jgi:hypothetical protein